MLKINYAKVYHIFKNEVDGFSIYRDTSEQFLLEKQLSSNFNTDCYTGLYMGNEALKMSSQIIQDLFSIYLIPV